MAYLSQEFLSQYKDIQPRNAGQLMEVTFLRTYAHILPEENRRERWWEVVRRVVEYSLSLYQGTAQHQDLVKEAELMFDKVFHLEVLPSGRTLWVGGRKTSHKMAESNFNCSFAVIDELEIFGDLFQLLLCGCGVGFRILPEDVEKLPKFTTDFKIIYKPYETLHGRVPKSHIYEKTHVETETLDSQAYIRMVIGDSREGWVEALRQFLNHLTAGYSVEMTIDFNSIRPRGSRINGFGGKAPGAEGLIEMFQNLEKIIHRSNGKLRPIDCLDLMNFMGKNVIVGGTRRSAEIALGSPEDQEFIEAKLGLWITRENLQRVMSNNSLVFEEKPTQEYLNTIFKSIKTNGEPGFFNLESAKRRRPSAFGTNPCITKDSWINTLEGPRQVEDLLKNSFKASVNGSIYEASSFWSTGIKKVYKLETVEGYELKLTSDHKVLTLGGFKKAKDLNKKDLLIINNNRDIIKWSGRGTFNEGWLLGSLVGDGCFSRAGSNPKKNDSACLRFWGKTKDHMSQLAYSRMDECVSHRSDTKVSKENTHPGCGYKQVMSVGLANLAKSFGITPDNKVYITKEIETASYDFYCGYLQGLFDADGSPQGAIEKGRSVRLSQSNVEFLIGIQRMLLRLGIKSVLHKERNPERYELLPNSQREPALYKCKASAELIISRDSLYVYAEHIGFSEPPKQQRLNSFISKENKRRLYKDNFNARLKSLTYLGEEEVFDCTVPICNRFDANGIIVHNCGEILLNSRGLCNLSTVNLFAFVQENKFNFEEAEKAIRLAARIGARMTNVDLSLPKWDKTQKEDRLLGVSMTGIMDALDEMGLEYDSDEAIRLFKFMRWAANDEATRYAFEMRIPRPLLVTTIKPEGTLSQLPTVSSGIHRSYAPYYIRRIRVSELDAVASALSYLGVPHEKDAAKAERLVFSFPIKTDAKIKSEEEPAQRQFERYLTVMKEYVDHNCSITITADDSEWAGLAQSVYEHWDEVIGISCLPKATTAYPQLPYEAITKEQYDELMLTFPKDLNEKLPALVDKFEAGEIIEDELEDSCAQGICPVR